VTAIVWFTRDLRVTDHQPLLAAVEDHADVVPLFVRDPSILDRGRIALGRVERLDRTLASLDAGLRELGGRLVVRSGRPADVIPAVAAEIGADVVHVQRDLTPFARARLRAVASRVRVVAHAGLLLVEPEAVGDVRVFGAFHRRWLAVDPGPPRPAPNRIRVPDAISGEPVPPFGSATVRAEAVERLSTFAATAAARYGTDRDRLDLDGTSRLSADLHLGAISVREVASAIANPAFRRQLAWRDWASHLLWWRPETVRLAWQPALREVRWDDDPEAFRAWREGRTGYPAVDAAMRQLATEGWIHNRARMIAASFLAKDLLLDWRLGERHFLETLVDGDVAANSLGWQWTAGVGTDAAPYFRVLNPVLQGVRFDPDGTWVRRWCPELRSLERRFVHRPWQAPGGPPTGYSWPIVDHAERRLAAIARYRAGGRRG
jgi:deoxyribodipyrimidine photo-lyase